MAVAATLNTTPAPERFHPPQRTIKIVIAAALLALGLVYLFFGIPKHHHAFGILFLAQGTIILATVLLSWWELREDGLYERRPWTTRTILYPDIRVVTWSARDPEAIEISFQFLLSADLLGQTMTILPADREAFLRALKLHTPAADHRI